ncbi:glycosyltransferase family 4 protein [Acidimicrobiia bacterium]|nr:glycosyltransferase family 4 protein [Acidimicrobiia bacterium]
MTIVVFFTFDISLRIWEKSGLLSRELAIYRLLAKKYGVKFILITYGDSKDKEIINDQNIRVLPVYEYLTYSQNKLVRILKSFSIPKLLIKEIDDFDIIKTNQLSGSWVAILYKLNTGKPLFIRTGYDHYSFALKEKKSLLVRSFYRVLTKASLTFSTIYSVTSNTDKAFLISQFKFNTKKLIVHQNWVFTNVCKTEITKYDKKILLVGRLEKQKNIENIIPFFTNDYSLDVVGKGSQMKYLENISEAHNHNVNFLGTVENKELLTKYCEYKFFIQLSIYEGNPKTILEAMSAGCIVVVSNIPNNEDIVKDGINGFLISHDENPVEKIKNIQKLHDLHLISKNAQDYITNNHDLNLIAKKEFSILNTLLDRN